MHQHDVVAAGVVEPGRHRDLHPEVARELDEHDALLARRELLDDRRRAVAGAVVDEDQLVRDALERRLHAAVELRQSVLFVEDGDHDRHRGEAHTRPDRMLSRVVSARRLLSAVRRRPTLSAALAYALLSLLLFAPALLPGHTLSASDYLWSGAPWTADRPAGVQDLGSNYEEADAVLQFQPFLQYAARELPDVPLWNPHQMGGRPFVANSQSALFSPFNWPSLLLPFWWSLGLAAALKVFCAALGAHLLARALGIRYAGALLTGLVYGFGLYFVVWLPGRSRACGRGCRGCCCASGRWCSGPGRGRSPRSRSSSRCSSSAATRSRASTCSRSRASSRCWRSRGSRAGRGCARSGGSAAGLAAGGLLAAVALLPFLELLARSGDFENRAGKTGGHFPGHRADRLRPAGVLGAAVAGADPGVRVLPRLLRGRAAADAGAVGARGQPLARADRDRRRPARWRS